MSHKTAPRRAVQACRTCRHRKTRCDAGVPKCSLCVDLQVECIYVEPQAPRIDPNTRLVLERIQHLEDRILAFTPHLIRPPTNNFVSTHDASVSSPNDMERPSPAANSTTSYDPSPEIDESLLSLPVTHDATANHVYRWPILYAILDSANIDASDHIIPTNASFEEATDVFLTRNSPQDSGINVCRWLLFDMVGVLREYPISPGYALPPGLESQISIYEGLEEKFFLDVHVFYPILRQTDVSKILRNVIDSECFHGQKDIVSLSEYCLLILVLCLGAFAKSGKTSIPDSKAELQQGLRSSSRKHEWFPNTAETNNDVRQSETLEDELWGKARLLLGSVVSSDSIEAVQSLLLVSVYMGARGRVLDSQFNIHAAARKCGIIAKRASLENRERPYYSDSFCRLFWVIYVYESDFASELSLNPPSGITRFEDLVPYPTSQPPNVDHAEHPIASPMETSLPNSPQHQDLAAFQISANSAIRRYLNRINAVLYNPKDSWRKRNHTAYATWLIQVSGELEAHHEAIHRNLPPFLLSADAVDFAGSDEFQSSQASHIDQPQQNDKSLTSHPWNVVRLKGRYCAGQYVIHRPFVEYVLLNPGEFSHNRLKNDMLEKCKICIDGCCGFVKVFTNERANCITNLFATGMATFTMVIILMIATISPSFQSILPRDIEEVIIAGQQNLRRFSYSIKEFEWHIAELDRLDRARRICGIEKVFGIR